MESLIISLVVAAVGGLGFLAHSHPSAFRRTIPVILAIILAMDVLAFAVDFGTNYCFAALVKLIPFEKLTEARETISNMRFLDMRLMFFSCFAFFYIAFLSYIFPQSLAKGEGTTA